MSSFKIILVFCVISFYIAIAAIIKIILFFNRTLSLKLITAWTRLFSIFLRMILNIKIDILGSQECLNENGNFIISNHLGYLDGIVISSLFKIVFVSKSEVRNWPLFGLMSCVGGTIFIDRKRKDKSVDYIRQTQNTLKKRLNVLVFPEGTSTNGERLYPFQSIHFQAPLEAKASILPITITYTKINKQRACIRNRDEVCWYGQVKFYKHFFRVFKLREVQVRITIHPKINPQVILNNSHDRKNLSQSLYELISQKYPLFQ
jgi:1-acyl-sn-glycerol-3-phosphate acyltransferase